MTDKEIIKNNPLETKGESSKQAQQNQQVSKALITQKLNNIIALKEQDIFNYLPLKEENGELKKQEVIFIDNLPWYETEYKQEIIKEMKKGDKEIRKLWEGSARTHPHWTWEKWEEYKKSTNTAKEAMEQIIWRKNHEEFTRPIEQKHRIGTEILREEMNKWGLLGAKLYDERRNQAREEIDAGRNEIYKKSWEEAKKITSTGEIAPLQLIKSNFANYQQEVANLARGVIEKMEEREKNWEEEKAAYEKLIADLELKLDEWKEFERRAKEMAEEKVKKGATLESKAIVNLKQAKERINELEEEITELEQKKDAFQILYEVGGIEKRSNERKLKDWEEAYKKWDAEKKEKHNKILKLTEENGEKEKMLKGRDRTIDYWANEAKTRTEIINQLNQEKEELTKEKDQLENQLKAELAEAKNQAQQYLKEAQEYGQGIFSLLPAPVRKGAKITFWVVLALIALWGLKYLIRLVKFLLRLLKWIYNNLIAIITELKSLLPASKPQEKTEASKNEQQEPKIETVKNFSSPLLRNSEPTETNKNEPATENKEQPTGKK